MFVLPTFGLGVIASPTSTSVFDDTLTFPTIQVFDNQSEFIGQADAPDYTIVHAKDTDKLYVWTGVRWAAYNKDAP
jgi:hypothetical protein